MHGFAQYQYAVLNEMFRDKRINAKIEFIGAQICWKVGTMPKLNWILFDGRDQKLLF
jgi:hypothetical protein